MTDKNVQRNVRSSGKEGLQTPSQKHDHSIGEHGNVGFGRSTPTAAKKAELLEKFKQRERGGRAKSRKGREQ